MLDNILAKIILFPLSLIYGSIIGLRNLAYDTGLVKSSTFNLPVINVGNLTVGGAGKTPHIEYLIRLLKDYINVGTLSRGYKRKTKGFRWVTLADDATLSGDEPLQFKRKFPEIQVAVAESRSIGIPLMVQKYADIQTILLDDAYQHRSVKPGLNILLTEYQKPYYKDFLLPVGRLRENKVSSQRADIIIISKCPQNLDQEDTNKIREELRLQNHQKLFFSFYNYLEPYFLFDRNITKPLYKELKVIVLAAIAKVDYLLDFLEDQVDVIQVIKFEDHHFFNAHEVARLSLTLDEYKDEEIIIITTEKDAIRLELHKDYISSQALPIFALPIEVNFHFDDKAEFDELIKNYLLKFTV